MVSMYMSLRNINVTITAMTSRHNYSFIIICNSVLSLQKKRKEKVMINQNYKTSGTVQYDYLQILRLSFLSNDLRTCLYTTALFICQDCENTNRDYSKKWWYNGHRNAKTWDKTSFIAYMQCMRVDNLPYGLHFSWSWIVWSL